MNKWYKILMDPAPPADGATPAADVKPAAEPAPAQDAVDKAIDGLLDRDDKNQAARKDILRDADKPKDDKPAVDAGKLEVKPEAEPKVKPADAPDVPPVVTTEKLLEALNQNFEKLSGALTPKSPEAKPSEPEKPYEFFKATEADVDAIIEGGEKGVQTLQNLYNKAVTDAVTLVSQWANKVVNPLVVQSTTRQVQEAEARFFGKYKDLEPVADLTREVAGKIIQLVRNKQIPEFKSQDHFFEAVAATVNKYIAGVRAAAPPITPVATTETGKGPAPTGQPNNGGSQRQPEGSRNRTEDSKLIKELMDERM